MKIDFRAIANSQIRNLQAYQPGKPIAEVKREYGLKEDPIKLASNENALGPSKLALNAISPALAQIHLYPDGDCYQLKQSLAKAYSISAKQLTIGNGSEHVLELIVKSYLQPGSSAVYSQYAFIVVPLILKAYGINATVTPALNWGHDIDAMINAVDHTTKVLYLVNPNNPTGTYTNENDFVRLMQALPPHVLVVVDEAYKEYMLEQDYPDTLKYLDRYPNLIITRTFSKIYGLAGLRVGYAIASPDITDILHRARAPFSVNLLGAIAAEAALLDKEHVYKTLKMNDEGMKQIVAGLDELQLPYIPSVGNFVCIDVGDGNKVFEALCKKGVIVRPLLPYNMPQHIRVTIGTLKENKLFLNALYSVIKGSDATHF